MRHSADRRTRILSTAQPSLLQLKISSMRLRKRWQRNLEFKALYNQINVLVAIFALKQPGWTDRGEQTLKGDRDVPVRFIISEKVAWKS